MLALLDSIESAPEPKRDMTAEVLSLVEQARRVVGDLRAVYGLQGTAIDTAEHTLHCIEIALTTGRVTAGGYDAEDVVSAADALVRAYETDGNGVGVRACEDRLIASVHALARVRNGKAKP